MGRPIKEAVKIAERKIDEIYTVGEWAEEMQFNSSKHFSRTYRNHFGERPKTRLIKIRINMFLKMIKRNPEIGCYEIAREIGLRDEVALNKFIKRHTGKPPSEWKNG